MRRKRIIAISLIIAFTFTIAIAASSVIKRRSERTECANQMHAVLVASVLLWPDEHNGNLPASFPSMSNELATTRILICPSDHARPAPPEWSAFQPENSSYEIVKPGLSKADTNSVFLRCRIHGFTGYSDDRLLDTAGRPIRKASY